MDHIPIPPQAPMPPPPGFGDEYAPGPGAIPVGDWPAGPMANPGHRRHGGSPHPNVGFMDDEQEPRSKKKKDKKTTEPIEIRFEGFMLQKAEPARDQKSTWARVGKRELPFDSKKLLALVKDHRLKTRTGPATDFAQLTANQQGVVTRLIEERKQIEKDPAADWILVDIQRLGVRHFTRPMDVRQIRVILKRQDKRDAKASDRTQPGSASAYQAYEIIDLNEPVISQKAGKGKKGGKKQHDDGSMEVLDEPFGLGIPGMGQDAGYGNAQDMGNGFGQGHAQGQGHDQGHFQGHGRDQHQGFPPQQAPLMGPMDMAQYPPPPGAFPVEQQYQQPPSPPFPGNPFMPNPELRQPEHFQPPFMEENQGGGNGRRQRARAPLRSPSPRPRRSSSARKLRQLEGEVEDLKDKMENWHVSSGSSAEGDSVFSRPQSGRSFTPPSTPPLSDAGRPRGSLHRQKSFDRRPEYRAQPRDRRYRDEVAEVRPAYTAQPRARRASERPRYSPERPRYSPERPQYSPERPRYRQERPRYVAEPTLQRSLTYDDYPMGRTAEPRYAPRVQRRLTDYDGNYEVADFNDQHRRRRDAPRQMAYEPVRDAFETPRYERELRHERRRSVAGGGAYYQ
ncbi:hypothetical protein LTR85_009456 [Meristemomyces frigidus]|nr:hypothetical protein LTR85_009456 [Meristemomyces frigidus]